MYSVKNFKSKKALRDALTAGETVQAFQPGPFGPTVTDGRHAIAGPHYPEPHRWYGVATVQGGVITSVK